MTNEEKILIVYNKITKIDNQIVSMDYENKSEEDSLLFTDLVFGKKALMQVLRDLGEYIE
jgi:hypothetical protein